METVDSLYQHYSQRFRDDGVKLKDEVERLIAKYYDRWELTAQAVACGVAVSSLVNGGAIDVATLDPQVREAFELAYPNIPLDSLATADPEQLAGYVNAWKGKLFEVQVRDQLNAGESVGGIQLDSDQHAVLAESVTQPGWDLQILDGDNAVVDEIQLKATESISYVRDTMERYPDVHVLATNDVADHADLIAGLSAAGISEDDLQHAVEAPLSEIANDGVWDSLLPGLPFFLIATRQGLAVFSGEQNWPEALAAAVADSAKSAVAIGGAYAASDIATEAAGDMAADVMGDLAADLILGVVLPLGVGFFLRKLLGGGSQPRQLNTIPAPRALDEKIISEWVMPRALLIQRSVGKYYLSPPQSSGSD